MKRYNLAKRPHSVFTLFNTKKYADLIGNYKN
nr:MAG TPA: hypothetical protein [Caudoviricetes sp.]